MVKLTTAMSLLTLTMTPAVLAKNCKGSLMYCGRELPNKDYSGNASFLLGQYESRVFRVLASRLTSLMSTTPC
ncbi:hypothetical protein QBC36DRAFT_327259 [Triangularia setosa]|uniref:Uncharacterized protein n=1 Tax=Triangularia setosa TaxID=2587417 RepID=A0AAN6W8U0_9PEZI|nr:hypothetical protein QBC36DRAFT_327259 [Podospora setosa]